jgi:hypothetical protein
MIRMHESTPDLSDQEASVVPGGLHTWTILSAAWRPTVSAPSPGSA